MANQTMTSRMFASLLALAALTGAARAQADSTAPGPAVQTAPATQPAPAVQTAPAAQSAPAQAAPQQPVKPEPTVWDLLKSGKALAAGDGVAKDPAKARQLFEEVMKSDNKEAASAAANALGKLATEDLNDPKLAAQAFDRGIELGNPWSMIARAKGLAIGDLKDQKQAAALYLKAIETDKTPQVQMAAYHSLGQLYLSPDMLSAKKATDYFQRAVDLGNPWSLIALGGIYDRGTGTKKNWTKARDYYVKALAIEIPQVKGTATYALGQLYSQPGHSAPKTAYGYFVDSQKYGNPWASMMVANSYLKGFGVKKSTATARRLYTDLRKGSDETISRAAAFQLGRSYSTGPARDLKLAEENFNYAAKKGDPWAAYFLAQLYIKDMPTKANRRKARELLLTLTKNDNPEVVKSAKTLLKKAR